MKPHSSDDSSDDNKKKNSESQETVDERLLVGTPVTPRNLPFLEGGKQLGPYHLVRPLGQGGSGRVWEAESLETGRRLALKVLTAVRTASPEALERFEREGRLASSVNHPNWVYLFGAEEIDGYPVITMELMSGGTLQDRLKQQGRLPTNQAVDLILDIIDGLEAAQKAGIVHRDVKPSNCFLDESGKAKIGDFGLSKTLEIDTNLTLTGTFMGTPSYASPEQVRGRDVDFRSDLYSAGATLYALITGKPPFQAEQAGEVLARIVAEEPTPFSHHHVDVPKGLQKVVLRTLAKEREKRYPDYASLRVALLPFSSQGLTTGSLARRFVAILVDWLILAPIDFSLSLWVVRREITGTVVLVEIMEIVLIFLYFSLSEKYWGRSLGKFVIGLRVTDSGGLPLTWAAASLRTVLFWSFIGGPSTLVTVGSYFLRDAVYTLSYKIVSSPLLQYASVLVMLSTMRRSNGYAGIHELGSNTRVRSVRQRQRMAVPELELPAVRLAGAALQRFGPYREIETIWDTESEVLLVAADDMLKRKVWIHRSQEDSQTLPIAQLALNPRGQLRWLQGSRVPGNNWDAYEAPSGTSLYQWVKTKGKLSWEEMFQVLFGTAEILQDRMEKGVLPGPVSLRQIWIDSYGQVRLLNFPAVLEELERTKAIDVSAENWKLLIHQMLLFGLEGKLKAIEELDSQIPRVLLPEYTRSLIDRICRHSFGSSGALIVDLKSLAERPAKVTRERRAGPLLLVTAVASIPLIMGVLMTPLMPEWRTDISWTRSYALALKDLEKRKDAKETQVKKAAIHKVLAFSYAKAKSSGLFLARLDKDSRALLESSLRYYPAVTQTEVLEAKKLIQTDPSLSRIHSSQISFSFSQIYGVVLALLGFMAVPAVIFSFLLRGGTLLYVFGITAQTETGEKASRFRCLLRALVAWSPFLLFTRTVGIDSGIPHFLVPRMAYNPSLQLTITVIILAGVIYSVVNPERGIQDRIARTHLVPR